MEHYEQALRIEPDLRRGALQSGGRLGAGGQDTGSDRAFAAGPADQARLRRGALQPGDCLGPTGQATGSRGHYEQALRSKPDLANAHYKLGIALFQLGRLQEAMGHWEQALRDKPGYPEAQNNLAWLLATLAPADGGDPVRAVTLAERACELTNNRVAAYFDTLAAAYAATGRFDDAIATAQKAIELAKAARQPQLLKEIELHLELYRAGRPLSRACNCDESARSMTGRLPENLEPQGSQIAQSGERPIQCMRWSRLTSLGNLPGG